MYQYKVFMDEFQSFITNKESERDTCRENVIERDG